MEAIFEESVEPLLKQASGGTSFYEDSLYVDGIMESVLAPLIDTVMQDNSGVYVKSHPKEEENKPHMEIHFSTTSGKGEKARQKLKKTMTQLSELVRKNSGKVFTTNPDLNSSQ
jgi:molybdopterin-biosynthesis enzyme MoeA-like protein